MVQIFYIFLLIFPLAYISGPFVLDLSLSFLSLLSLIFFFKNFKRINNIYLYLVLFWIIYLILNSLLSIQPYLSLQSSLFYFRFFLFALFIYFILEKYNFNNYKYVFFFQFLIIFFLLIDSLFQFYFGYNFVGYTYNGERISSLNIYIFISFIIIILSGDRLALLNFLIIFSCYIIYVFKSSLKFLLGLLSLNLLFLFFVLISETLYKRFILTTLDQLTYNFFYIPLPRSIEYLYNTAFNIFIDYPIFGIGPKLFRIYCEYDIYKYEDGCSTHPHNTIIQLFLEIGIFGILPFLSLLFYMYFNFFKNYFLSLLNIEKFNVVNFLNVGFIINLLPLIPSGNFFNNRYSFFIYLYLSFYFFYKNKKL